MKLPINDSLLEDMGLSAATDDQKREIVTSLLDALEANVALRLGEELTDEQSDEFAAASAEWENESAEQAQAKVLEWMKQHGIDYENVVQEEFEKLKTDTTQKVDDIMAGL